VEERRRFDAWERAGTLLLTLLVFAVVAMLLHAA